MIGFFAFIGFAVCLTVGCLVVLGGFMKGVDVAYDFIEYKRKKDKQ